MFSVFRCFRLSRRIFSYRNGIVFNQTSLDEDVNDTVWILGAIEKTEKELLKIIEKRSPKHMNKAFEGD